jgi:polyisoprenoid-binding protein YceI
MKWLRFAFAWTVLCACSLAQEWQIDRAHSAAQFSVRHLMVSTVRGQFGKLTGTVQYDPKNPSATNVQAEVDVTTIDTREPKRDAHLKSADFFEAERYPTITFRSTKVEPAGPKRLKLTGDLTMKGITKQVVFDIDGLSEPIKDRAGLRMGATAIARISRKEFGITWNKLMETGGVTVSDEVDITLDIELVQRTKPGT